MSSSNSSRRSFLKKLAASSAFAGALPSLTLTESSYGDTVEHLDVPERNAQFGANDQIQFATIGMGIMGFLNTQRALQVPGTQFVAAADCYDSRLVHTNEQFGKEVTTTRDYREILDRSDIDAVIVATPDHWHSQIAVEAMEAGKHVYCEKPMVQHVEQAPPMVQAQLETGKVLQVGSQRVSSVVYNKARELFQSGIIGTLTTVEASLARNNPLGAWQYSIPPNVSTDNIWWERFLGDAPDMEFDADRFFRWRKYWDYGTGIPGDLFVHQISGIHRILDALGPTKIYASGGLRYWTEKREVPDVMLGLYEYPETESHPDFTLSLNVNQVDAGGGGEQIRFIGRKGVITVTRGGVSVEHSNPSSPSLSALMNGWNSVRTFSEDVQEAFAKHYRKQHESEKKIQERAMGSSLEYRAPSGYNSGIDHHANFFDAVRTGSEVVEDVEFGFRAAAPAVLSNRSYRDGRQYQWDPVNMELQTQSG